MSKSSTQKTDLRKLQTNPLAYPHTFQEAIFRLRKFTWQAYVDGGWWKLVGVLVLEEKAEARLGDAYVASVFV